MITQYAPYVLGFGFVIFVGQWRISRAIAALWAREERPPGPIFSGLLGLMEGVLFLSALLVEQGAFIAVWLGVKVASQYVWWGKEKMRHVFHIHLIGTALSLMYAGSGYLIVTRLQAAPHSIHVADSTGWVETAAIAVSVVALTEYVRTRAPVIWREADQRAKKAK